MRILLLSQFFYPDESPATHLLTDLAIDLAAAGHEVSVLTSSATTTGLGRDLKAHLRWRGIDVRRVFCGRFDSRRELRRSVSYLRFLWGALLRMLLMRGKPEVMLVVAFPPRVGTLASIVHRLRGVPYVCWLPELPDESSRASSRNLGYGQSAGIVVPCEAMRRRMQTAGVSAARVRVIHNWGDSRTLSPIPRDQNPFLRRFGQEGRFLVLYPGDWHDSEELETLAQALRLLPEDAPVRLVMVGDGPQQPSFEARCRDQHLPVQFLARQPRAEMAGMMSAADLGLLTLRPEWEGRVTSFRMFEFMAAGRPWLYVGPSGTVMQQVASRYGCGWHIEPGDADGLLQLLLRLAQSPQLVHAAGQRARAAFSDQFDRSRATREFESALRSAAGLPQPGVPLTGAAAAEPS